MVLLVQSYIDSSGNFHIANEAVWIQSNGVYSSHLTARNGGETLALQGNQTAASGSPSVDIIANSGLNASDVAIRLGSYDGNRISIQKNGMVNETSKTVTTTNSLTTYTAPTKYNYLTGTAGASFAITFPAGSPSIDGQKITIMSTAARASTTWISSGATFVGAPTSLSANVPVTFQYDYGTTIWYITQ